MKIVIIGGDAAGMSAASQARRQAPEAEIVVLEATGDVSYGACGLPYKLAPEARLEELGAVSAQAFREERRIDLRLGHRVLALHPAAHRVEGEAGGERFELGYDRLLIATGARAARPPIPGLEALLGRGAYTLKTLEDGRVLRRALAEQPRRALIVGGGYIGLEASEGLRALGLEVTILEALPELLPFLPAGLRARALEELSRAGVEVLAGTAVRGLERAGSVIRAETGAGPREAELVLVATGVRPNAELAAAAGIALGAGGAIAVDDELRTSAPDIYAAGDCADARHGVTGERVYIPLALRANRSGKLAGGNLLGGHAKAPPVMGTAVFKLHGLEVARSGLSEAEARAVGLDAVGVEISANTRAHYYPGGGKLSVWLLAERGSGRLLGGALVGPESAAHRIDTIVAALHARLDVEELLAMDLAYAPPFGPAWSPILTAASQLAGALRRKR